MVSIHFFVEQVNFTLKQKTKIRQWIHQSILSENKVLGEINYIFCSDEYLLNINRTFLHHDSFTDIITFPIESILKSKGALHKTASLNGEIYISIERVKENAKKFNTKFGTELMRVMIHGVLHLCGYSDKSPVDKGVMRALEDFYLKLILSK